jgi:hypothetical protein
MKNASHLLLISTASRRCCSCSYHGYSIYAKTCRVSANLPSCYQNPSLHVFLLVSPRFSYLCAYHTCSGKCSFNLMHNYLPHLASLLLPLGDVCWLCDIETIVFPTPAMSYYLMFRRSVAKSTMVLMPYVYKPLDAANTTRLLALSTLELLCCLYTYHPGNHAPKYQECSGVRSIILELRLTSRSCRDSDRF